LGNPHNASVQAEVEKENATFGDILQEDFYEAYRYTPFAEIRFQAK